MVIEAVGTVFTVHTINGFPAFGVADRLEREALVEAGMGSVERPSRSRHSPTTFHVAVDAEGVPQGVACSTVGPFADLPLGLALAKAGADIGSEEPLPGATCELVSLSVDAEDGVTTGVTEALYRSFYLRAKESGARCVAVGVDPWLYDVLTEQYGVPFTALGPTMELLGRELLAIGGEISVLEEGIAANAPAFLAYLNEPGAGPGTS